MPPTLSRIGGLAVAAASAITGFAIVDHVVPSPTVNHGMHLLNSWDDLRRHRAVTTFHD